MNQVHELELTQADDALRFSFASDNAFTEGMITGYGMIGIWYADEITEYLYDYDLFDFNVEHRKDFVDLWNDIVAKGWPKKMKIPIKFLKVTVDNTHAVFEYNIVKVVREMGTWEKYYKSDREFPSEVPNDMEETSQRLFGKSVDEAIEDKEISGEYA